VPSKNPTFVARRRLKKPCPQINPERGATHEVERVTGTSFNPIKIIVKLRNILNREGKVLQKNRRAARTKCPRRPEEN
jgi:hypothetical protein